MITSGIRRSADLEEFHEKFGDLACDIFDPEYIDGKDWRRISV